MKIKHSEIIRREEPWGEDDSIKISHGIFIKCEMIQQQYIMDQQHHVHIGRYKEILDQKLANELHFKFQKLALAQAKVIRKRVLPNIKSCHHAEFESIEKDFERLFETLTVEIEKEEDYL